MGYGTLTSRRVWIPLTIVLLGGMSLLPQQYAGFAVPVASTTRTVISPLSHPLKKLSSRVREHVEQPVLLNGDDQELSNQIIQKDRELLALEAENRRLKMENRALQNLRDRLPNFNYELKRARVIGRNADATSVSLLIDVGSQNGVLIGNPAVSSGSLVGRVSNVGPTTSAVEPITTKGMRINAIVVPPIIQQGTPLSGQLAQFEVKTLDRLEADVSEKFRVEVGDFARLSDRQWVDSAQQMIVGRVVEIQKIPEDLLRKKIIIRPLRSVYHIDKVTVIVPKREDVGGTENGGGQ